MTPEETSPIARAQRDRDALAKAWMLELIERTPLEQVDRIDVAWLAREGPVLVRDVLRALNDRTAVDEIGSEPETANRAAALQHLRRDPDAPGMVQRDLSVLQALLIGDLLREPCAPGPKALGATFERLAEIFGAIQAAVTAELVRMPVGEARADPLTGLPRRADLDDWMRAMIAGERRYGTPFTILLVDVDGLGRINDAYGREAGDRMLAAVAAVIAGHIRAADRAFRLEDDELCVLLPQQGPIPALPAAERLASLVAAGQGSDGPRVDIAIGVAACPEHGRDAESLLSKAEEASYAAKAAGERVSIASGARPAWLQDG